MKLLLALLITAQLGQNRIPSFPTEKLRKDVDLKLKVDKVKKILEITYDIGKDSTANVLSLPREYIFNKNGDLETIHVLEREKGDPVISIEVDKCGRILSQKRSNDFLRYEYKDRKRMSKEYHYNNDKTLFEKTVVLYDSKNRIIKKSSYRSDKLSHYSIYEYNEKGDQIFRVHIYTLNGPGVTLDSSMTGGEPKFTPLANDTTKFEYLYGDTLVIKEVGRESRVQKITKQFSTNDTLIFQEFKFDYRTNQYLKRFERKELSSLRIEEYTSGLDFGCDKHKFIYVNNQIRLYKGCNTSTSYQHVEVVDEFGNWTTRTTLANDKKTRRTERIIEYW